MTGPLPTYSELRASHRWVLPRCPQSRRRGRRPAAEAGSGDPRHGRPRDHADGQLRRAARELEQARERPRGGGRHARRPDRDRALAAPRDGDRARRDLQARRDRRAAEHRLRARRARRSAPRRRAASRDRRVGVVGARACARLRRRPDRRRPRSRSAARRRLARLRAGGDDARHACAARLHVRHDRAAQGCAPRPPRPRRPPARVRALARLLPAAGRPDLDAGRLGVDRRPLRRPHARPRPRNPGGRIPGAAVRPRAGVRPDRPHGHPQRLHARDRAAPDAAGRRAAGVPPHRWRAGARRSARRPRRGAASASACD